MNVLILNSQDETQDFHFDHWHEKDPNTGDDVYKNEMTAFVDVKGLKAIEDGVFRGCSSLVTVGLPAVQRSTRISPMYPCCHLWE